MAFGWNIGVKVWVSFLIIYVEPMLGMEKHEQKLEAFKANPTVRPGMEHMPQERIQAQQAQRAEDIKIEIQRNFVDKIMEILGH